MHSSDNLVRVSLRFLGLANQRQNANWQSVIVVVTFCDVKQRKVKYASAAWHEHLCVD